jgi:hypothetical protein
MKRLLLNTIYALFIALLLGCATTTPTSDSSASKISDADKKAIGKLLLDNVIAHNNHDMIAIMDMYHPKASIQQYWGGKKRTVDYSGLFRGLETIIAEKEKSGIRFDEKLSLKNWRKQGKKIYVENESRYTMTRSGEKYNGVDEESFELIMFKKEWRVIKHRYKSLSFTKAPSK